MGGPDRRPGKRVARRTRRLRRAMYTVRQEEQRRAGGVRAPLHVLSVGTRAARAPNIRYEKKGDTFMCVRMLMILLQGGMC